MNLKSRLVKLEGRHRNQPPRFVIRLIGDESYDFAAALEAAKAQRGLETIPDDDIFVIQRLITRTTRH